MDNSSNLTGGDFQPLYLEYETKQWALYGIVVGLFLAAIYCYLAITCYFVFHCCTVQPGSRWKCSGAEKARFAVNEQSSHSSNAQDLSKSRRGTVTKPANRDIQRYRTAMLMLCELCAFCCFVHFVLEQLMIWRFGHFEALVLSDKYTVGCMIVCGYLFFWVRQRLFYNDASSLRHLYRNKFLKACSAFSLFFVVLNAVTQMALVWYLYTKGNEFYDALSWLIGCTAVQSTLLILFLFPLYKLNRERRKFFGSNSIHGRASGSEDKVVHLMRRCAVMACIQFFSDFLLVLLMVIHSQVGNDDLALASRFFADVNCILNVLALVGSFGDWRKMLFPWRICCLSESQEVSAVEF